MKALAVLQRYFNTAGDPVGYNKKDLKSFKSEIDQLSKDEKNELATLAGAEMGVEVEIS